MKYVERRSLGEIKKTCGGGMKRSRERRRHLKSCQGFHQKKNKTQYKRFRNHTRKTVAGAMRIEANQELNNLYQNSSIVCYFLRRMKKEGKDLEGGR